jgi:hypothetical protein
MKSLEEKYKEKIKAFSLKLTSYEEMLKYNTTFRTLKKDKEEDDLDRVNVRIIKFILIKKSFYYIFLLFSLMTPPIIHIVLTK